MSFNVIYYYFFVYFADLSQTSIATIIDNLLTSDLATLLQIS